MKIYPLQISVPDSPGSVSAEITEPEDMKVIMSLGHGAGAGMDHAFLKQLSLELAGRGIGTIRYNFNYIERRSRRPDRLEVCLNTIGAVVEKTSDLFPGLPMVVAGKSFGGRMSSHLLSSRTYTNVSAIIFYGFPLHPVSDPGIARAEHLKLIRLPMLFLQGSKDDLARIDLIEQVCGELRTASLEVIPGANHSFRIGKKESIVDLAKKSGDWLQALTIL